MSNTLRQPLVDYESSSSDVEHSGGKTYNQPSSTSSSSTDPSKSTSVFANLTAIQKGLVAGTVLLVLLLLITIFAMASRASSVEIQYINGTTPALPGDQDQQLSKEQQAALDYIAFDLDYSRDLTADPCQDFYRYACGGWVDKTVLNGTQQSITKGFKQAADVNAVYIQDILRADWPIVTPYFESCMNSSQRDMLGASPIKDWLKSFDPQTKYPNLNDAFYNLGFLRRTVAAPLLLNAEVRANQSSPRQAVLTFSIGGVSSNRWQDYVGPNNTLPRLIAAVAATLQAVGDSEDDALANAKMAIDFETSLVKIVSRNQIPANFDAAPYKETVEQRIARTLREEQELAAPNDNWSIDKVSRAMPNVPVVSWLDGLGVIDLMNGRFFNVPDEGAFPLLNDLIANTTAQQVLAYGRWRAVNATAPYLSLQIRDTYYQHLSPLLGLDADIDRTAECTAVVVNGLADLFGRYFVQARLPPITSGIAFDIILWIKDAWQSWLPNVSWMDDATRKVAQEKSEAMLPLIGGPKDGAWSDYSQVQIKRNTYFDNFYQISAVKIREQLMRLNTGIPRNLFQMNPSIVNAQYSATANTITFPAGILIEPFYSYDNPMALNLGRYGMVAGHEILHGFDNNGRQFDKNGERKQWWDSNVIEAFINKTQCLIDQYDAITVQGSRVNGTFCLGENIADNGGLHMAYIALQKYKADLASRGLSDPLPKPKSAPLTTDQLFYWAHAQTWCTKATDAAIARQVVSDVHSPGEARVWAPLVNQDGFGKAYNCPVGSRMNPEKKCDLY